MNGYEQKRHDMVSQQLESRGITDAAVLRAMTQVPREAFVPDRLVQSAYDDSPQSISNEQTISQPYIVAFMTEVLKLQPHDKVLEIGTGSGYQAAVLAEIVDTVYTIEIIPELLTTAREILTRLNYTNIYFKVANGRTGWPEEAPFDKIIITAAGRDLPPAIIHQLKPGGRLIMPIGDEHTQDLVVVDKDTDGRISREGVLPVTFVPLR